MKPSYDTTKNELIAVVEQVSSLLVAAESIPGTAEASVEAWEKVISGISRQIPKEILRVAVVGSIKSGKSTFINAVLENDYLKRGAGVITSIVTRVRKGGALKARLFFKSWDEINAEINAAMVLFPALPPQLHHDRFDIRRRQDRRDLSAALDELSAEQLISHGQHNADSVLLSLYLKGYHRAHDFVDSETTTQVFANSAFGEHRAFVGTDALAVYLRDIQLEVDTGLLGGNLEMADCQGVDSLNPHHLTMIQDYLLKAHLIIYVVSSRTGLRQADIRFLSMIKKMGIVDNAIFIINCDFNEHDSLENLHDLVHKTGETLSFFQETPRVFSFSALFDLFKSHPAGLPARDRHRFDQWESEAEFASLSNQGAADFKHFFHQKVTRERFTLLLRNHLERSTVVLAGIGQWIQISREVLSGDNKETQEVLNKIDFQQQKIRQLKSTLVNTVNGVVNEIKRDLKHEVDRFFDPRSGRLIKELIAFVRSHHVSLRDYRDDLGATGFANTLYLVFQEFKHAVNTFMTETLNPEIVEFVREREHRIVADLLTVASPFDTIAKEACTAYNRALGMDAPSIEDRFVKPDLPDLTVIKDAGGLSFPPAATTLRYSAKIKTDAVLHFGFFALVKQFRKLLRMTPGGRQEDALQALEIGISRMKRETEKSFLELFVDYKESLKFQYLFKLVNTAAKISKNQLLERLHTSVADLSKMADTIGDNQRERERTMETLTRMDQMVKQADERMRQIREQMVAIE